MQTHGTCEKIQVLTAQKIDSTGCNSLEARGIADKNNKIIRIAIIHASLRVTEIYWIQYTCFPTSHGEGADSL